MSNPDTFDEAIGRRLQEIRLKFDLPADSVAETARLFGLNWRRSTVSDIEAGTRKVRAVELLLLPMLFSAPKGRRDLGGKRLDTTLEEILDFDSQITPSVTVQSSGLRKILHGEVPDNTDVRWPEFDVLIQELYDSSDWRTIKEWWPDIDIPMIDADRYTEVERVAEREMEAKLAARLDIKPLVLAAVSFRCWGRSLSDERDSRTNDQLDTDMSASSRRALRGQVTRQLLEEIRATIESIQQGKHDGRSR